MMIKKKKVSSSKKKKNNDNEFFWVLSSSSSSSMILIILALFISSLHIQEVVSFTITSASTSAACTNTLFGSSGRCISSASIKRSKQSFSHHVHYVSSTNLPPQSKSMEEGNNIEDDEDYDDDDEKLLESTPKEEFMSLCRQFGISSDGTKQQLLERLRNFAKESAEKEKQRLIERKRRVEEGGEDDRERFEILGDDDDDDEDLDDEDDDGAIFYYYDSSLNTITNNKTTTTTTTTTTTEEDGGNGPPETKNKKQSNTNSNNYITVPPIPPNVKPNEKGERVVTVYSTKEQNDLTGVAATQPGQAAAFDPMTSNTHEYTDGTAQPWDINANSQQSTSTSSTEIDHATEEISELVRNLLAMTGLPAFQQDDDDDDEDNINNEIDDQLSLLGVVRRKKRQQQHDDDDGTQHSSYIDFDPSLVPTEMLTKASKSLRTDRGKVLQDVIRKFELNAIGYDGAFGDNISKGGGNYRQVSRVRSFLEGYRRAEVRRISRDTATLLLDKLVSEGIEGLDIILSSMIRSGDDTSEEGGELNDSLLDYLNDAIRQQEKKVEQLVDSVKKVTELETTVARQEGDDDDDEEDDSLDKLWTVDSDGIETFDPNTPESKKTLRAEYEKVKKEGISSPSKSADTAIVLPKSAPERLLLLLKLLRERVKTEAAFSHDEKARNLRVLAYALNLHTDDQRKELLLKEFGSSLDRLDSFKELVASSIEYAESTSHQLQPSKTGSLDVELLKRIHYLAQETKEKQSWKASGTKPGHGLMP